MKKFLQKNALYFLIVALLIILVLVFILIKFLFFKTDKKPETELLINKISQIVYLPTDETPSIATVTDPVKLKNQNFFENAKTGDKVLIYTKKGKAVLYDPIAHKVVNISNISLDASLENNSNINKQEF